MVLEDLEPLGMVLDGLDLLGEFFYNLCLTVEVLRCPSFFLFSLLLLLLFLQFMKFSHQVCSHLFIFFNGYQLFLFFSSSSFSSSPSPLHILHNSSLFSLYKILSSFLLFFTSQLPYPLKLSYFLILSLSLVIFVRTYVQLVRTYVIVNWLIL